MHLNGTKVVQPRVRKVMDLQFEYQEHCLIIKPYGTARVNERLLRREAFPRSSGEVNVNRKKDD